MTQTLTTKVLNDFITGQGYGVAPSAVEAMARELLANREAQPVAYLKKSIIDSERFDSADPEIILHPNTPEGWLSEYQAVFTAPPAPAVPEETDLDSARMAVGFNRYIQAGYVDGWNACRAAMLDQPVSQGCDWTYDEHDYKWDSGCGEAWMFSDGGPTENGVKFCQSCGKPVLLAAAPEGGN